MTAPSTAKRRKCMFRIMTENKTDGNIDVYGFVYAVRVVRIWTVTTPQWI